MKNKYHLYHRVSKAIQADDGQGIERQQQTTRAWIEKHNDERSFSQLSRYMPGNVYEDSGRSGYTEANFNKGKLGQLMRDIELGHIEKGDIIVIELIDRFSRSNPDFVKDQLRTILKAGVKIAITKWNIVFENGMRGIEGVSANLLLEIGIYLANQESEQKSERIRATNDLLKKKGKKHIAKTPFWLVRTPDLSGHEVIEENAEIVRKVFDLRLEKGMGAMKIVDELKDTVIYRYVYNDDGELVKSVANKPICESSVRHILRNPNVIGRLNDEIYYPPIIAENMFYAVQNSFAHGKGGGGKGEFNNIFRNVARCGCRDNEGNICGYSLAYEQRPAKYPNGVYLKCNNKRKRKACSADNINYYHAQEMAYEKLKTMQHDKLSALDVSALEAQLDEIEQSIRTARDFMMRFPDDSEWTKKYEGLIDKRKILESEIKEESGKSFNEVEELNLDLSKSEDRFRLNQIFKDNKISFIFTEKSMQIEHENENLMATSILHSKSKIPIMDVEGSGDIVTFIS